MKKIIALLLAVMMVACLFAGCTKPADNNNDVISDNGTGATSDADYIMENGKLKIGMTLFAPMNYYDDENEFVGFETEFAKAVCEKIGVEADFQEIDWNSKEIELNAKNIDCVWNGMTITPERAENMEISKPYMANKQVLVVKAENAEKYAESLLGASVVAEAGSAGEEIATSEAFFKDAAFTPVDSMAKALMDVAAGTSDAAVVDYVASIGSIGEGTDFEGLVVVEGLEFSPEEYGIAFRKGSDMATLVNNTIDELIADGTLDAIAAKYKLDDLLIKE